MKRLPALLILVVFACRCGEPNAPTPSSVPEKPGQDEIAIAGTTLRPSLFLRGVDRSRVMNALNPFEGDRAAMVGFARARHIHVYGTAAAADYDVAFLDAGGKVVETGRFASASREGLTSGVPAKYALVLRAGWLEEHSVSAGSRATFSASVAERRPEPLPAIRIGDRTLRVELSRDNSERTRGLMYRRRMSADEGMLFCYPNDDHRQYWMRNTFIPLDLAFIASDGTVLNVEETPIWDDPVHGDGTRPASAGPCRFVLEVNMGWFRRNDLVDENGDVRGGVRVEIPDGIRKDPKIR
ncbi:MAG: DUF192 domain-containing protein [Planctomycetota bacterium]|jgi:uncharacterized membrane protein (UPF0127 family)